MEPLILVINPGNTSTKVALFKGQRPEIVESLKHSDKEIASYKDINSQKEFRQKLVLDFLKKKGIDLKKINAVASRGGLLKPLPSGTFLVNDQMLADLRAEARGSHASNLAAQIGQVIAKEAGVPCYVVDPVSVDEYQPLARYSGHKQFQRIILSHALNTKAVAKRYAREQNAPYDKLTLLVIHLGTGVSISIHREGRMIDAVNPSEEGAFSLDRSGGLPILQVARYIIENHLSYKDFEKMVFGNGGVYSYLGIKDFFKVEEMYRSGNREAIEVVEAMAYQIAKETGGLATVVSGKVDAILITGGMAQARFFVELIKQRISHIAPIHLYPGEDEMQALAEGVLRVLNKEEKAREY